MRLVIFLLSLFISTQLHAVRIQFLHTNDMHSYFESTNHNEEVGGYASIKTLMDRLEKKSSYETLRVDAGDFLEGNLYFMADFGQKSFQIKELLEYDLVTLGNHDYLMGTSDLNRMLKKANPSFPILATNMSVKPFYTSVREHVKGVVIKEYDGVKIAFIGLTTDQFVFKWRLLNGTISKPIKSAKKIVKKLKKNGIDYIVAINHLGLVEDRLLAEEVPGIDLIIGGHSHQALRKPLFVKGTPIAVSYTHLTLPTIRLV